MRNPGGLPPAIRTICDALVAGLASTLNEKLYGIYLYGATVFEDGGPAQDIDLHIILTGPLSESEREAILDLHGRLAMTFPPLGAELDAYYILLEAARAPEPPQHQLRSDIYDNAWALHCAHVRAGYYTVLYGPKPDDIFPEPAWTAAEQALDHELDFVRANLRFPAYCVLNLCRILYSFQTREVAVSKRFSGRWAGTRFPAWRPLIAAALRRYDGTSTAADDALMDNDLGRFLDFAEEQIKAARSPLTSIKP